MRLRSSLGFLLLLISTSLVAQTFRGTILGTVTDPQGAVVPGAKVTIHNVSKKEGNSGQTAFVFEVDLSDFAIDPVVVSFATAEGTATPLTDYTPATGVLAFDPGMSTQTITVNVIGDTVPELDETFFVNLFDPSDNAVIDTSQGVGTILNDD